MTMMTKREKLYFLLDAIDDARTITPSGQPILIHPANDLNNKYRGVELDQLFTKLEKDDKVLKVLKPANRIKAYIDRYEASEQAEDGYYHIELLPSFDAYFLKIQQEPEYFEFTGKKPQVPIGDQVTESVLRKAIFGTPTFSVKSRQIADQFSPENYQFVLMVLKKIISLAEFSPDGEVHYKLQSPFGQEIIKERSLLKKFESQGLFKHLREDGVFGIATLGNLDTKLIKEIVSRLEEREAGVITSDESEVEDIKKRYDKIVQDLREPNQLSELKERYNKALGEIKSQPKSSISPQRQDIHEQNRPPDSEINLTDTSSRRAYEKKWDVLQAIWDVYESHSRPDSILVPVARLTIKGRETALIDGIIEGFKKESLFQKWDRKDRWYNLEFINHEKLPDVYKEIGEIYKQFATTYKERDQRSGVTDVQIEASGGLPYCVIEKGWGYLKFGKHGAKKKISRADSRPFKFLQATIDPLGVYKSVDAVFSTIWMEKDNQDSRLTNPSTASTRRVEIIKNSAIKELQKGNKLDGKIKFEFNHPETLIKAVLAE